MSGKNLANQNSKVMKAFLGSSFVVFCLAVSMFVTTAYGENPAGDQSVAEVHDSSTAVVANAEELKDAFDNEKISTR